MKFHNKFIAVGLAIGLSFTGGYVSYSWFTYSIETHHNITIDKLVEESIYCTYDTGAEIVNGDLSIDILEGIRPIYWPFNEDRNAKLKINTKHGEMKKLSDTDKGVTNAIEGFYTKVEIPSNNIDIKNIDTHSKQQGHVYPKENNYIDVVISSYIGQTLEPIKSENYRYYKYRIVFTRHNEGNKEKLCAYWIPMEQPLQVDLDEGGKEETEEIPEQIQEEQLSENRSVTLSLEEEY